MDILAGMLAYVAGIGALFAGVAVSFFVFFATPTAPLQMQKPPQSASAMLVRPSTAGTLNKRSAVEAHSVGRSDKLAEKQAAAAGSPGAAKPAGSARDQQHKAAAPHTQARRLIQEERARRWAYQQDSSFESRFLGYAD
jgi:hypothetical protein